MSLAGLKKQINKANQFLSEQMGAAEPTKLDDKYHDLERKLDATDALVEDLLVKTREYLQPNPGWKKRFAYRNCRSTIYPATRAKMLTATYMGKIRGSAKGAAPYPQPEGELGDAMIKHGRELIQSPFGQALVDTGEAYRQMADIKYNLEDTLKQNFLDPLTTLQSKDLKEVAHHRKKLMGRRLDYDCKKRQKSPDEEMIAAEEKLEESKRLAETAMWNVLDNDTEQLAQLCALVDAQLEFHTRTVQILEGAQQTLKMRMKEAQVRQPHEHAPTPVLAERTSSRARSYGNGTNPFGASSAATTPQHNPSQDPWGNSASSAANNNSYSQHKPTAPPAASGQPSARVLFDFEAENPGELAMKEGQVVQLTAKIDENWFEGKLPNGKSGFFPVNYVQVLVPLR